VLTQGVQDGVGERRGSHTTGSESSGSQSQGQCQVCSESL
jgi:hypothetical protein